jgi:UDP-N-acetylmuramate dehydrogenase
LSGIPGWAGATPIQNVGAYGQEVAETIFEVEVLDRATLEVSTFSGSECRFRYRDSLFKSEDPDRFVVLSVRFRLQKNAPSRVQYAELQKYLDEHGIERPSPMALREAVLELRRRKSMLYDPTDENGRSCGSFFTNPILDYVPESFHDLGIAHVPRYPQPDGRVKIPAAWLIEQAGFSKGQRMGPVGLSTKHALAIVAHDGARAKDVLAFADMIRKGVRRRSGIDLVNEPVVWT